MPILALILTLLIFTSISQAATYVPSSGKVYHGLVGGDNISDFQTRTGKHPAVWQHFGEWVSNLNWSFNKNAGTRTRHMIHLSTARAQDRPERISPGQISRGEKGSDRFLLYLNLRVFQHGAPVYIRAFGEMNNCHNAYAAYNCSGSKRSADHSQHKLKQAFRRMVIVVRGGRVSTINSKLRVLEMPKLKTDEISLPRPKVAFVWSPMTGGSPMVSELSPAKYWPGSKYVDWVGTSFYSKFPTWHYLNPFYNNFAVKYRKPFALAEWAMWGSDNPGFVKSLYSWVGSHPRTKMMLYNQGNRVNGPFRLKYFPRSAREIKRQVSSSRYVGYAYENR